ncbi:MAG: 50S ribosomal protein L13 [Proteobacteria bacterium]|nr:50S ribosomal protein L13 [Pseudomonadota bacterium]
MKTYWPKKDDIKRNWYLIDAKGKVLGRIATKIAELLIGKGKTIFTPAVDTGDFVVVINAKEVVLTGKKWKQKTYNWHTGYPGGFRSITAEKLRNEKPEEILWQAVYGMLPKNKLRDHRINRLKIYTADNHPHIAQNPVQLSL